MLQNATPFKFLLDLWNQLYLSVKEIYIAIQRYIYITEFTLYLYNNAQEMTMQLTID